eukprot:SAG11_NODE_9196_length_934_cov_0.906587_1_plen_88_part_00
MAPFFTAALLGLWQRKTPASIHTCVLEQHHRPSSKHKDAPLEVDNVPSQRLPSLLLQEVVRTTDGNMAIVSVFPIKRYQMHEVLIQS